MVKREPKHTKNGHILSLHIFLASFLQQDLSRVDPCLWFILFWESCKPTELVQTRRHRIQKTSPQVNGLVTNPWIDLLLLRTCGTSFSEVTQSWGTLSTSKSTNRIRLIPFVKNPHYGMLVHKVRYLKKTFVKITGHCFPGWV